MILFATKWCWFLGKNDFGGNVKWGGNDQGILSWLSVAWGAKRLMYLDMKKSKVREQPSTAASSSGPSWEKVTLCISLYSYSCFCHSWPLLIVLLLLNSGVTHCVFERCGFVWFGDGFEIEWGRVKYEWINIRWEMMNWGMMNPHCMHVVKWGSELQCRQWNRS